MATLPETAPKVKASGTSRAAFCLFAPGKPPEASNVVYLTIHKRRDNDGP
jgi:hypothetical protein